MNNQLSGTGILNFNGTLIVDLSGAEAINGNSWQIVAESLTASFSETFNMQDFSETEPDSGEWIFGNYTFSELTGTLSYSAVPEPSTYAVLAGLDILGFCAIRRRRNACSIHPAPGVFTLG